MGGMELSCKRLNNKKTFLAKGTMAFGETAVQGKNMPNFLRISVKLPMFTVYFAYSIIAIVSAVVELTFSIYKMQRKQKIEILKSRDVKITYINQKCLLN